MLLCGCAERRQQGAESSFALPRSRECKEKEKGRHGASESIQDLRGAQRVHGAGCAPKSAARRL